MIFSQRVRKRWDEQERSLNAISHLSKYYPSKHLPVQSNNRNLEKV